MSYNNGDLNAIKSYANDAYTKITMAMSQINEAIEITNDKNVIEQLQKAFNTLKEV